MSSASSTMKAAISTKIGSLEGDYIEIKDVEKPSKLGKGQMLVKIEAAAINPVDWKLIKMAVNSSGLLGCDYAGTVVELGPDVKDFSVGDKVAGFTPFMTEGRAAFAEYLIVDVAFAIRKPSSMTIDEAATLGVGCLTAALGMYYHQHLPRPNTNPKAQGFYLVWGGSSSVGLFAVQLAKLSGFEVIATCSPRNFDLVKSMGAAHVLDSNRGAALIAEIGKITNNNLKYALDCIGAETALHCAMVLSSGGILATIAGLPSEVSKDVAAISVILGEAMGHPDKQPFLEDFISKDLNGFLLKQNKLKGNPTLVLDGGLKAVQEAFSLNAGGKVSGKKLVILPSQAS